MKKLFTSLISLSIIALALIVALVVPMLAADLPPVSGGHRVLISTADLIVPTSFAMLERVAVDRQSTSTNADTNYVLFAIDNRTSAAAAADDYGCSSGDHANVANRQRMYANDRGTVTAATQRTRVVRT